MTIFQVANMYLFINDPQDRLWIKAALTREFKPSESVFFLVANLEASFKNAVRRWKGPFCAIIQDILGAIRLYAVRLISMICDDLH